MALFEERKTDRMKDKNLSFNRFYPCWKLTSFKRKIWILKCLLFEFTLCKLGKHQYPGLWAWDSVNNRSISVEDCYCTNCSKQNPEPSRLC